MSTRRITDMTEAQLNALIEDIVNRQLSDRLSRESGTIKIIEDKPDARPLETLIMVGDFYQRALQIGLKHPLAVYDSVYIALAQQLGYSLITVDQRQMQAAKAENIAVKAISDFVLRSN